MDTEKINLRIGQILTHYELSAAAFADSIQVQRSSISHLLKGRNKPSLEFVTKVVRTYPEVDLYWLLFGEGNFPKGIWVEKSKVDTTTPIFKTPKPAAERKIEKIVLCYTDGTFSDYKPES